MNFVYIYKFKAKYASCADFDIIHKTSTQVISLTSTYPKQGSLRAFLVTAWSINAHCEAGTKYAYIHVFILINKAYSKWYIIFTLAQEIMCYFLGYDQWLIVRHGKMARGAYQWIEHKE